jgi:hypothetical protein
VLPLAGVELFGCRQGHWFRPGGRLPVFDFPTDLDLQPLARVLTPAPVQGLRPPENRLAPVEVALAPDTQPRTATAMAAELPAVARWADTVPEVRLAGLEAASCESRIILKGRRLPLVPGGERYWGKQIWAPLGWRLEPALPESAIVEALGVQPTEILLVTPAAFEVIARAAFAPLTRAAIRRACREGA